MSTIDIEELFPIQSDRVNLTEKFNAVKTKEYSYNCPNCADENDNYDLSEGYNVDGENYPKYFNTRRGSNIDGNYHDWEELHCCRKCHTLYWFSNGAY